MKQQVKRSSLSVYLGVGVSGNSPKIGFEKNIYKPFLPKFRKMCNNISKTVCGGPKWTSEMDSAPKFYSEMNINFEETYQNIFTYGIDNHLIGYYAVN